MHALSPPANATPPQTLKMCGVSKWLSLGPKTRAWLRLQLLMKQTSGDCDGSSLENSPLSQMICLYEPVLFCSASQNHSLVIVDSEGGIIGHSRLRGWNNSLVMACVPIANHRLKPVQHIKGRRSVVPPWLAHSGVHQNTRNIMRVSTIPDSL